LALRDIASQLRVWLCAVLCVVFCFVACNLTTLAQATQTQRPKLVVLIVVDQFPFDYLSRYRDKFGEGGLRFLMDNGATFNSCNFKHATTLTACGHAVISTGTYPWANGIVANEWFDRRKGKLVKAIEDESLQIVGGNGSGVGSRSLIGTTVGDQMKLASNGRGKVITVALKDRAALLLAGRLANSAYWWDSKGGNWVTSSQYSRDLPSWVRAFNDLHYADKFFAKPWQRLLPENQYTASTKDDYPFERTLPGDGRQFPHVITGGASSPSEPFYQTFGLTPWANQMVADFAIQAIEKESLGQHAEPDLLGINFAAGDYVGHTFGPYSQEAEDIMLRFDRTLAGFLNYVDGKIGLNNCLVVLSSDHGIMPIPEFLKEKGMDAGRIDPRSFRSLLDSALDSKLGADDWIEAFEPPNLYLNLNAIDKQKYRQPDVEAVAAKLAHSVPGVGDVYTAVQFFMNQLSVSPTADPIKKTYFWGRSGELVILPKPGYIFWSEPTGTTHGSPYSYDTHVPLMIYGGPMRAGDYGQDCSPADIAPTIAAILGIDPPSLNEGRVLSEAMAQVAGPPRPRIYTPPADTAAMESR
jgi:predicted AlkP superfamily pyrophosphatase or phosphodiesterase